MSYILSDGTSTTNEVSYIEDFILLEFSLFPTEVPYTSIGFDDVSDTLSKSNTEKLVRERISNLVKRVGENSQAKVSLKDVDTTNISKIKINITINDIPKEYEIKTGN